MSGGPGALVIGGASGIGAAVVARYRERGVPVVVWDVRGACDVRCDIAEPADVTRATAETIAGSGIPRWVTVTAGVGHAGALMDVTPDEWDRVLRINTRGPWLCLRAIAHAMAEAGVPGSLVATSSVSAHLADPTMGAYCASKAALNMLVQVAAVEWGPLGIRVNAVAPGVTMTPMVPDGPGRRPWLDGVAARTALGRLGQAEDVAQAIHALHEMEWVTGQILDCDGGLARHSPIGAGGPPRRTAP